MTANELRKKFLDFMESREHKIIPGASLVPENDPSVLFTTAGMQQFKEYYLDPHKSENSRVATIQKCLRTGDIDEVGDKTHLTFFEMLGNFSFGYPDKKNSYFKEDTINYGWEFLTKELKINKERIYATYFKGENNVTEDIESLNILKGIKGLKKIVPQGFEDNFWSLGTENSPGGPTVEFYVDGIEVWNCVFNEYVFKNGNYEPAGKKGVDTGMGLERLLAVLNGKETVFETDLFWPIIEKVEELWGKKYEENEKQFRIITDHIKASVFMLSDGVEPSNKDRGYVLRRLIRRAVIFINRNDIHFDSKKFKSIAQEVLNIYKDTYQEFKQVDKRISILEKLTREIRKFRATIENGLKEFSKGIDPFILFTTYGFPIELTKELAKEKGIEINESDFNRKLKEHQELSRTASAGMFKGGLADAGEKTTQLHTTAHLMLAAMRRVLGPEIYQKGSNINAERLRFDFNYPQKLTAEQIKEIEGLVNQKIQENIPVEMIEMPKEEALKIAKISFDPSKYGEKVKVYKIGNFSVELCGGPHIKNTGDIKGIFKIKKEESSSAGVRRIKAIIIP